MANNGDITHEDFLALLVRKRKGRDLREFAGELGVSFQFLSMVLRRNSAPGPKLAAAMGYKQVIAFQRLPRGARRKQGKNGTTKIRQQ